MSANTEEFILKERLIDKSVEAYALALETINRITIQYRIESFCHLICNAWELLLKAKIINDGEEEHIYYKKQDSNRKRTISLRDCLKRVFPNRNNPSRRNIEYIEELRDESVHLVIGYIPRDVVCLFQANAVGYHKHLNEWFGESLSDRTPVGMMSIVYDMSPESSDLNDQQLRRKLGPDAADFLTHYCAKIKQEFDQLHGSPEFSIGIEYRLVLTKRKDDADITLSAGPGGEPTQIVEVPKDPSKSHPFRQKEVLDQVRDQLHINAHDILCINKVYKVKNRPEYFYQGSVPGSPGQYSQAFVDWLVKQHSRDECFFRKAREKVKQMGSDS